MILAGKEIMDAFLKTCFKAKAYKYIEKRVKNLSFTFIKLSRHPGVPRSCARGAAVFLETFLSCLCVCLGFLSCL